MRKLMQMSTLMVFLLSFISIPVSVYVGIYDPGVINKEYNHLVVKGDIIDVKADVNVFEFNSATGEWNQIEELCNKSRYKLYLNPTKNYQVWFSNVELGTKVLHIDAGDPGVWSKYIGIDFHQGGNTYARIYQDKPDYDYILETVEYSYASVETLGKTYANNNILTNNTNQ